MRTSSQPQIAEHVPLYVRWNPELSPYAVELRLDLVTYITSQLTQAERDGIEIGGMLIGTLPGAESSTVRADEVALVARRFEDGAIYMLDPNQKHRLDEIRESARERKRVPVGFFRSNLRPGALQPSLGDKTFLADYFGQSTYVLLLIQSRQPRTAAFFLASGGLLSDQPTTKKFFFDDSEFKFLPEVKGEELEHRRALPGTKVKASRRYYWWLAIANILALALFLILAAFSGGITRWFRPLSNKAALAVNSSGDVLKISWDHNAPFVVHASGAVVTVVDGPSRRDIHLGSDELKLGEVDYQYLTRKIQISMSLDSPGSNLPPQTFNWSGQ